MKTIELTQGKVALVDDDDFDWLSQWEWYTQRQRRTFYAVRNIRLPNSNRTLQLMHRAILEHNGVEIAGLEVDHRNHDGLDNQKLNLRAGTVAQNQGNQTIHDDNFVGVCLCRGGGKPWQASIGINGKMIYIGRFDTALEAALARDQYIIDHGLEGYPLNFPEVFR